ncbi:hypothetical protein [Actinosynnema mirum]|uniref:Lipoprotein n=1 Tax=Actinosynnema mirum (strain ATCC 29888 / DSM 43827 / JCM 3225 / NBRC 14064 / NCIMB 13271 / NRRL B-12336 / IMRU 3971 / 101) TaxID=446462 RepID=C6WFZ3_ACTMD|nr:hypothetical protein [Actinosynnema mirum]ACU37929.1 hypothetical protein Amir_4073 [Actinosynnema mirum DSM 43827]
MRAVLVAGAVVFALVGCSAPEVAPGVASLSSGTGQAPAASAERERPRERLDMSPEDLDALWKPHQECVAERSGVPVSGSGSEGGGTGMRAATPEEVRADEAAQEACVDRQPLPPWEKDPANPEAHDFAVRVVDCLRGKGVKHVEVAVDETLGGPVISLGGEHNDSASISAGLEHVRSCETEASKK